MSDPEPRYCAFCDNELVRKPNEERRDFLRRKFCNRFCSSRRLADGTRRPVVCGIYEIRNTHTGKVYIGSSFNIHQRWRKHRKMLRGNRHDSAHLQASWNKYGAQAFTFSVIETVDRHEDLIAKEQEWFARTRCNDNRFGYNADPKAGSRLGAKASDETKRRISAVTKGRNIGSQHHQTHLTEQDALQIKQDHAVGMTLEALAKRYDVSSTTIGNICRGKTWQHVSGPTYTPKIRSIKPPSPKQSRSGLSEADVLAIKELLASGKTGSEVARLFGVNRQVIGSIRNGKTWLHVGGPILHPGVGGHIELYRVVGSARSTAKLTETDVLDIKQRLQAGEKPTAIGKIYGVAAASISLIRSGRNWSHVPWPTPAMPFR